MRTYATTQEFFDAYAALTHEEKLKLYVYADRCAAGTRYSHATDIIHEVILRVADGRRHWPRDLDVAAFLAGCVKSLASAARQRSDSRHVPLDSLRDQEEGSQPLTHEPSPSTEESALRRERERLSEAAVSFVRGLLAEDLDGTRVLNGMIAELTPQEMKSAFGLSPRAFAAARQRVVNRLKIWVHRHPDY